MKIARLAIAALLLVPLAALLAGEVLNTRIPVTSHMSDVFDDPETRYSGAPQFDWSFFGGQTKLIAKYAHTMPAHRHQLGIEYRFYMLEMDKFKYPPVWFAKEALEDKPAVPTILFARVGKINSTEESEERARAYDLNTIERFVSQYPNAIFGGGEVAEVDSIFNWQYKQYYARLPVGVGGAAFPAAYFDFIESNLKRSPVPYMSQQHNRDWGTHYVAGERIMSLGSAQLFYRHNQVIVPSLVTLRSAARQYPFPYYVQFSGQIDLAVSNESAVVQNGARPVFELKTGQYGANYQKSYALCRQVLYLSWLNGARFFNWETGELIRAGKTWIPSPLGTFTAQAAKLIEDFGPIGPVQTPIALVSEFSHVWRPPSTELDKRIHFTILGDVPYVPGDYQMHGIRDLFFPHYLQSEMIYEHTMGEDYAICATPYGESVDLLLSDVRPEALTRYGLVIWTGVPPLSPSMARDKLLKHIRENKGRVVLFGAAARSMFPEWFANDKAERIASGAGVVYRGRTFTETADFVLEKLREGPDAKMPSMNVLSTVNGKPLVVECMGGLVLALSDYGINNTPSLNPSAARWSPGELVTQLPHTLLRHARLLLDDEARKQSLFSVGNEQLHYVVTRPRDGEYVLGIFNDRLQSEPFKITSNVGEITSLVETDLKDNKAELKSVVGGAAYAPPGLRSTHKLPLDYGLSDAQHIEGRDVRLFRIRLQERGVWAIPPIRYPSRPANRVLAVAGLEHIRRYLQEMPSFLQWFDGIKVDAEALLSVEDAWIVEQGHWLDRRGVRVVADATGIAGEKAALVIAKLALLKRAPKDLLTASPSPDLKASAARNGVRVLAPSAVNRVSQKGHSFQAKAELHILELHYQSEEDLYCDLRHFAFRQDVPVLRGVRGADGLADTLLAATELRADICDAGPNLSCLKDVIQRHRAKAGKFNGIKIDSTYLLSKTVVALAEDAVALAGLKLKVIVDMRPDQIHFERITFYPHIPNYNAGLKLYQQIIDKMQALGAKDLILRLADAGEMRNKEKYIRQRDDTWNTFAALAARQGINLHLALEKSLKFSDAAGFSGRNVFVLEGAKGTLSPFVEPQPKTKP